MGIFDKKKKKEEPKQEEPKKEGTMQSKNVSEPNKGEAAAAPKKEETKEEAVKRIREQNAIKVELVWYKEDDQILLRFVQKSEQTVAEYLCHRVLQQAQALRIARNTVILSEQFKQKKEKGKRILVPGVK